MWSLGIYVLAAFWAAWSTIHFGYNWFPQSHAELLSDGLVIVLIVAAIVTRSFEKSRPPRA